MGIGCLVILNLGKIIPQRRKGTKKNLENVIIDLKRTRNQESLIRKKTG
jgi:S-adenosylmethionine:tRNA-ribosyltransferase-isomerase (queuine synthetase)